MNTFLGKSLSKVFMARFNEHFIAEEPQRSPHYALLSTLFYRKSPSELLMAQVSTLYYFINHLGDQKAHNGD